MNEQQYAGREDATARLNEAVRRYRRTGWAIHFDERPEGKAFVQLTRAGDNKNCLAAVFLLCAGIVPGLIYLAIPARAELMTITLDNGYRVRYKRSKA